MAEELMRQGRAEVEQLLKEQHAREEEEREAAEEIARLYGISPVESGADNGRDPHNLLAEMGAEVEVTTPAQPGGRILFGGAASKQDLVPTVEGRQEMTQEVSG